MSWKFGRWTCKTCEAKLDKMPNGEQNKAVQEAIKQARKDEKVGDVGVFVPCDVCKVYVPQKTLTVRKGVKLCLACEQADNQLACIENYYDY